MEFKKSALYGMTSDVWSNWSSLNAYQAALSSPVALFILLIVIIAAIVIDTFCACKYVLCGN